MNISTIFRPDYDRYEGVRPINVYLLRLLFLLVFLMVGYDSGTDLLIHQGPWDPVRAAAVCMWAGYPVIAAVMPWKYFVETCVLNRPRPCPRLAAGAAA